MTFWGAGSGMNATGITEAARVGFPRERMMYVTFGGAEEDMVPAGEAAIGTYVVANVVPGRDFPLIKEIEEKVYGAGQGNLGNPERVGTVYWNRGVAAATMWVEGLRNAQGIHGKEGQPVTGPEFRDGYEAIDMTEDRLAELGMTGMIAPFKLSCEKHDGSGRFKVMQWDGERFQIISEDFVAAPDESYIRGLVEASAAKFAEENNIVARECPST